MIVSAAELIAELGLDRYKAETTALAVESIIQNETGRVFSARDYDRKVAGTGADELLLPGWPIISIDEVDGYNAEDYWIDNERGILHLHSGSWPVSVVSAGSISPQIYPTFQPNIRVKWRAGYEDGDIPHDLRYAGIVIAKNLVEEYGRYQSESIGDWSYTVAAGRVVIAGVETIISRYRRRRAV